MRCAHNPLLMTVMGANPAQKYQGNPPAYFIIDKNSNAILRIVRGHPMQSFEKSVVEGERIAKRLGRPVIHVVHPYIPAGFKTGTVVSPLFYNYGANLIYPEGGMGPRTNPRAQRNAIRDPHSSRSGYLFYGNFFADSGRTQRTLAAFRQAGIRFIKEGGPNLFDVYVPAKDWQRAISVSKGALTGLRREYGYGENPLVELGPVAPLGPPAAVPLVNPHLEGDACRFCGGPLVYMGTLGYAEWYRCRDCGREISTPVQSRRRRVLRNPSGGSLIVSTPALLEAQKITGWMRRELGEDSVWLGRSGNEWGVFVPRHISGAGRAVFQRVISKNPQRTGRPSRARSTSKAVRSPWAVCRAAQKRYGFGPKKYERCVRKVKARGNPKSLTPAQAKRILKNPGGRKRVTVSLEKFAQWVKKKNDPALTKRFRQMVEGYRKWTHGSMPDKVTVEKVNVPGVSGLWLTYDAGKAPESTYIMPQGSKRKGAWKHPWDTMPRIKHDPQAGVVLTKLAGQSRITDFYHK